MVHIDRPQVRRRRMPSEVVTTFVLCGTVLSVLAISSPFWMFTPVG